MEWRNNMSNKKKENLIAINEWCKSMAQDEIIYIENALYCNNRWYKLSISKHGIGVFGNGKFSKWLYCNEDSNSLFDQKVGSELIYNWKPIKERILSEIKLYKKKEYIMENFVV